MVTWRNYETEQLIRDESIPSFEAHTQVVVNYERVF